MSNERIVKVGMVQTSSEHNEEKNLQKMLDLATEVIDKGAEVVCLQELFRSDYFCQTEDYDKFSLAEIIPGPSTEAFSKLASKKRQ